jgi:hypothetical protein
LAAASRSAGLGFICPARAGHRRPRHSGLKPVESERKPPKQGLFTVIALSDLNFGKNLLQELTNNKKVLFAATAAAAAVAAVLWHISCYLLIQT